MEIEGKDLLVYPNPTSNTITIQSDDPIFNEFQIYDQLGRAVHRSQLSGYFTEIDLSHLSQGSYIILVNDTYKPVFFIKN